MKFSLVIPVAPDRGAEIIESIKNLDYPKSEFHVVIVKGTNPSWNRNKGAEKAGGEIISFLDDDAVVRKDMLKKADEFFRKHPEVDIVGGPQLTPPDEKGFARISGYALSSKFGAWRLAGRYSAEKENLNADEGTITSANLFCRKKVMQKVKFDTNFFPGEDPKFIDDAKKAGFRVGYSPEIVLYHRRRATIRGLIKQMFSYGRVRPAKESFLNTLKRPFFLGPSIFAVYLIALAITSIFMRNIWFSAPLILYAALDILFSLFESIKNQSIVSLLALPFIYPMIHISYGMGMICGYGRKILGIKEARK